MLGQEVAAEHSCTSFTSEVENTSSYKAKILQECKELTLGGVWRQKRDIVQLLNGAFSCTVKRTLSRCCKDSLRAGCDSSMVPLAAIVEY